MNRLALCALVVALVTTGCSTPDDKDGGTNNDTTVTNNDTTGTNNDTTATNNSSTNGSTGGTDNVVPEDCADDEVFVSDYCQRCGPANGCSSSGPECRPTCSTEGEACETGGTCRDGACRRLCG